MKSFRLPPLIDKYSHTLGCLISSQKLNVDASARIACNISPKLKGFYINAKGIAYKENKQMTIFTAHFELKSSAASL